MNTNEKKFRGQFSYLFGRILFIFLVLSLLSSSVNASSEIVGNITVYVKDQDGNNVNCFGEWWGCTSHLVGDTVVELWYGGVSIANKTIGATDEYAFFNVNHTGPYTIRAVAKLEYINYYKCSYDEPTEYYSCATKCPDGTATIDADDRGPYTCISGDANSDFRINHTYIVAHDVITYVDRNEADIVQVTLPTDEVQLGRSGEEALKMKEKETEEEMYWLMEKSVFEEVGSTALKESGILKKTILANPTATVIVIGALKPEDLFTEGTALDVITSAGSGVAVDRILKYGKIGATKTKCLLGIGTSIFLGLGWEGGQNDLAEAKLCEHAETDDLDVFVGDESYDCTTVDPEYGLLSCKYNTCLKYPVILINKGEKLFNAYSYGDCICSKFIPDTPHDLNTYQIFEEDITESYDTTHCCSNPNFIDIARLNYALRVLNGTYCDLGSTNPFWRGRDNWLSQFQKTTPHITIPIYPTTAHLSDPITISAEIIDDRGISSAAIDWSLNSPQPAAPMTETSGSDMRGTWQATLDTTGLTAGTLSFKITATDTDANPGTNDNDQQMFKIHVVEDAGFGRDANDSQSSADTIPTGQTLTGYLIDEVDDVVDWYKLSVNKGQQYSISATPETDGLVLLVDDPDTDAERFPLTKNVTTVFGNIPSTAGTVYIGFSKTTSSLKPDEYSFGVSLGAQSWVDPLKSGNRRESSTDWYFYFVCGCNSEQHVGCCDMGRFSVMGAKLVEASVWSINDQFMPSIPKDQPFDPGVYSGTDQNGVDKDYIPVEVDVSVYAETGWIQVLSIIPIVDDVEYPEDRVKCNDGEWSDLPANCAMYNGDWVLLDARVPVIDEKGNHAIKMEVNYFDTGTGSIESVITEPFGLNLDIEKPPEINKFGATADYNSITLTVDASDDDELDYVKFYFDGDLKCARSLSGKDDQTDCNIDTSGFNDNAVYSNTYVKVYDFGGKFAESYELDITVRNDNEAPSIGSLFITPVDGLVLANNVSKTVNLSIQTQDSESGVKYIYWYGDGVQFGSGYSSQLDTKTLSDGTHTIGLKVRDKIGNTATKDFTINVDNSAPTVGITTPQNNDVLQGMINLEASATDNTEIEDIEWFLDGAKIGSGTRTLWGSSGLDGGYTITAKVTDIVGNVNEDDVTVTVISPDLSVDSLRFSPSSPEVGDLITITATVTNDGSAGANDVNVTFYDGDVEIGSGIINMAAGGTQSVSVQWTVTEGGHNITAVVDPEDWIIESGEGNNLLTEGLTVGTQDTCPPTQSNHNPASGSTINTNSPTITFNLNENGDCKWSISDQPYGSMVWDCAGDGTTSQSCVAFGLSEGANTVYIACQDTIGNKDTAATNTELIYTVDTLLNGVCTVSGLYMTGIELYFTGGDSELYIDDVVVLDNSTITLG